MLKIVILIEARSRSRKKSVCEWTNKEQPHCYQSVRVLWINGRNISGSGHTHWWKSIAESPRTFFSRSPTKETHFSLIFSKPISEDGRKTCSLFTIVDMLRFSWPSSSFISGTRSRKKTNALPCKPCFVRFVHSTDDTFFSVAIWFFVEFSIIMYVIVAYIMEITTTSFFSLAYSLFSNSYTYCIHDQGK